MLAFVMARPEGIEPPTLGFEDRYSIQLSYGRVGEFPLARAARALEARPRAFVDLAREKPHTADRKTRAGIGAHAHARTKGNERSGRNVRAGQERQAQAALHALVRQSRQSRHDRALYRALPQFRPDARASCARASRSSASPRPAPTFRPATAITSSSPSGCATASSPPAACRSSFRCIRSRRPASGRPRRSTAISPISASSRCSTAISSTASC